MKTKHWVLIIVALALLYLVASEADFVRDAINAKRYASDCESGDLLACRQAAVLQMQGAETFDEMQRAAARYDELCAQGSVEACRSVGYIRTDEFGDYRLGDARGVIYAELRSRMTKKCTDGEPRACIVWAWFLGGGPREQLVETTKKLCTGGDRYACMAWGATLHQQKAKMPTSIKEPTQLAGFCAAGYTQACVRSSGGPLERCLAGEVRMCKAATDEIEDPDDAAVLGAIAAVDEKDGNPGLYGVKLPKADHQTRCDAGSAIGCLAAGLELVDPYHEPKSDPPKLPPLARLDATFGKACDQGAEIACLALGVRLLDRPLDEERNIETANARLSTACDAGVATACRLRSFEPQMLKHDYSGYRDSMERACMLGDRKACSSFASLTGFELGGTPFPISNDIGIVHLRRACATSGNPMACANVAFMYRHYRITPDLRISSFDAASTSCGTGYPGGCVQVFWAAKQWWPDAEAALRDKICDQVPAACEE